MAQPTVANIIADARLFAQDTATTSPAVSDANATILLQDVILRYEGDVEQKEQLVSATTSGLTFAAGDTVKTTSADVGHLLAAHPSDSASVNTLQTPAIALWSVREMLDQYNDSGSGTSVPASSSEFQAWAWEKVAEGTPSEKARVYVWPPLNRTRYLTLRQSPYTVITATSDTVDADPRKRKLLARLLAWEMARLHTRDESFLQQILAPIPAQVLNAYFQSGQKASFLPNSIKTTGALDG